jgi:hypothetical protein
MLALVSGRPPAKSVSHPLRLVPVVLPASPFHGKGLEREEKVPQNR